MLHLRQSAELLEIVLNGTVPAGAQMERYFRAHPKMGTRDRGEVAETVYGCLRRKRTLEHICGVSPARPEALVAAFLLMQGVDIQSLEEAGFRGDAHRLAERARTLDPATLPFAVRADLPDWLAERLLAQLGEPEALALACALNEPAPVDLRVNTLKADREDVRRRLAEEGLPCTPTPFSPVGLRSDRHAPFTGTGCFQDGFFEIQDEGSQLVALLLEPKRHETVVDFCAGAGGKALHLAALMADTGTVYAFDVSPGRLEKLKVRLQRAGARNVHAVAIAGERDERVQRLAGKVDRVLVDAPCSGTGTLRRDPNLKWRPIDLPALTAAQKNILEAAAALVKPGGRLVYATCSLLREENDEIVMDFLARHRAFQIVPATEILARRHVPITVPDDALRLYPHRHDTDGFYAVVVVRK